MRKSDLITKLTSFWIFYRWHPEVALRYLPLVKEINKMGDGAKILEVGSGGLGIVPYLRKPVTGIDIEFKPPIHPLLTQVRASATKLPFESSSFDAVISVDMLEHLSCLNRKKAIEEMIRVARQKVLVAVPCGRQAYEQDLTLNTQYQRKYGSYYAFLEEQVNIGLPEKRDISYMISSCAIKLNKKINLVIIGNENIKLRYFLMKGWMNDNIFLEIFFRKILLLAIPIFKSMNYEPTYRNLFMVDIIYENRN